MKIMYACMTHDKTVHVMHDIAHACMPKVAKVGDMQCDARMS